MKIKDLFQNLDYGSFSGTAKVLDVFYDGINRALNKKDSRSLQCFLADAREWYDSINNHHLNCMRSEVDPLFRGNVNKTYYEVKNLLKVIEEKIRKLTGV